MLLEDRFPAVWQPSVENKDARQLLLHRCRMVRCRARVKNRLGLIPAEKSSSDKRRLGHIGKQGNTLVRRLPVEAASKARRYDPSQRRQYLRLSMNKHH